MKILKSVPSLAMIATLSACGGGGDDSVSRVLSGTDALNFGTVAGAQSASQLPFAGDDFDRDADFAALKLIVVRFISDEETGETVLQVSEETASNILVREDSEGDDEWNGTVTFGGEEIRFVEGVGERANGARIFLDEGLDGIESTLFNIYSYVYDDPLISSGENTDGFFVLGLQTNPEDMPSTTGVVTYSGDFYGYSTVLDQEGTVLENEVEVDGTVSFDVRFANRKISGSAAISADVDEGMAVAFTPIATILLDEADIVGNGFATTANTVENCDSGNICTADADLGGVFFGTSAEGITGIATYDYKEIDAETGSGLQIFGAGGFAAGQDPASLN